MVVVVVVAVAVAVGVAVAVAVAVAVVVVVVVVVLLVVVAAVVFFLSFLLLCLLLFLFILFRSSSALPRKNTQRTSTPHPDLSPWRLWGDSPGSVRIGVWVIGAGVEVFYLGRKGLVLR